MAVPGDPKTEEPKPLIFYVPNTLEKPLVRQLLERSSLVRKDLLGPGDGLVVLLCMYKIIVVVMVVTVVVVVMVMVVAAAAGEWWQRRLVM